MIVIGVANGGNIGRKQIARVGVEREELEVIGIVVMVGIIIIVRRGASGVGAVIVVRGMVRCVIEGIEIPERGQYFIAVAIGKSDGGGHALGSARLGNTLNDVGWHGQGGPAMADNAGASGEVQEIMATLGITGGSKANGAECTVVHVVGVFLMGLDVGAERETHVFVKSEVTTH